MAPTRRTFIKAGALGALFAGIPLKIAANVSPAVSSINIGAFGASDTLPGLNLVTFSKNLNTAFHIRHANTKTTTVKLVAVNDLKSTSSKIASRECFTAVFLGSHRPDLRQDTYVIDHGSLGKFSLLLVPSAYSKDGQYYEATFNRL